MNTADFGPGSTPTPVKWFIILACVISIASGLVQGILAHLNIFPGSQEFLGISWWGVSSGFLWQPLTYAFIHDLPSNDLTFSFFLAIIFYIYIFWVIGSAINSTVGSKSFMIFLTFTIVATGFLTICLMRLFGNYAMLTGLSAVVVTILVVWCMRFPASPIFLFMLIPINSLTLGTSLITMIAVYALFEGELHYVLLYLVAVLVSYLYAALVWGWTSPFPKMAHIDEWLLNVRAGFTHNHPTINSQDHNGATIIDIDTGKPTLQDDAFVDEMLEKIAKKGEDSLSWREKERLQKISEKKKRGSL